MLLGMYMAQGPQRHWPFLLRMNCATTLLMTMQTKIPRAKLPLMTTHPPVSFIDIQLCLTTLPSLTLSSMLKEDHLDECSSS